MGSIIHGVLAVNTHPVLPGAHRKDRNDQTARAGEMGDNMARGQESKMEILNNPGRLN